MADRLLGERVDACPPVPDTSGRMEAIVIDEGLEFVEHISQHLVVDTATDHPSPSERRLRWSGAKASGYATYSNVRAGVSLMVIDAQASSPWAVDVLHQPTGLELGFVRSTGVRISNDCGTDVGLPAGSFGAFKLNEAAKLNCHSRATPEQSVRLMLDPTELRFMLGCDELPAALEAMLRGGESFTCLTKGMTAEMFDVVDAVSACTMIGPMRQLYLEGKALELIALAVDALGADAAPPSEVRMDADLIDRLEHARQVLLADICEPPSLRQLARRCGLNERKLKEGFKQRFGTTVFAYVRQQRMSRAHDLLVGNSGNVGDVAQRVGYANASKFAAAFRRQFGISPSAVGSC